jgi:hypothetical protein
MQVFQQTWKEFPVGALGAGWIGVEKVTPLQGVGQHAEGALPGAVQQVESALHLLPVRQVEEGVGDRFRVATLQHVLRRQDHWLHFQQVLHTQRQNKLKSDLAKLVHQILKKHQSMNSDTTHFILALELLGRKLCLLIIYNQVNRERSNRFIFGIKIRSHPFCNEMFFFFFFCKNLR